MKYKISKNISQKAEQWNIGILPSDSQQRGRITHVRSRNLKWMMMVMGGILFLFLVRIFYISSVHGDFFRDWSENNHLRVFSLPGPRGLILDRNGEQLVENISENILLIIPADIPKSTEMRSEFLTKLAEIISVDYGDLQDLVEKNAYSFTPLEVASGLDHETVVTLKEVYASVPSVFVSQRATRKYRDEEVYSHILGYVAPLTDQNIDQYLEKGYVRDERIGVSGLEKQYEEVLHGENGKKIIEINAHGDVIKENISEETNTGKSLSLTLIHELQKYANDRLKASLQLLGKLSGVVIVSDVKTGGILAAVSLPTFDSNMFGDGIKGKEEVALYNEYLQREDRPLLNRLHAGLYAPASTYKIVTASAVLEEKGVSVDEFIDSPGRLEIIDQFDPSKKYFFNDWKLEGHGPLNIVGAIAESSDTFFYQVVGGFGERSGIGPNFLAEYSRKFGLGSLTGVDLPGELSGVVPDPDWKRSVKNEGWFTGDTYNMSIGQGYLLVTPLQVNTYTSIIANNGVFMKPHFNQDAYIFPEEIQVSKETLKVVSQGLYEVVNGEKGTAKSLQSLPFTVAGKTGTGQFNNNQELHAWFTGYAPFENPEVVITVLVEGGGEGSAAAVPIARDVLDFYMKNKK